MNVLIVDDQPEVVESMVTGVNWKNTRGAGVYGVQRKGSTKRF